jgi:tetratricopeptide (TPR) repeat protein
MKKTTFTVILILLALSILAGCSGKPEGFDNLKAAGMKAFLDGQYSEAREYFLEALNENPSDKETLYFTGLAYRRDFDMDSALIYIKRADLYSPKDREINHTLYEVAVATGDWKYAQRAIMVLVETGDPLQKHLGTLADLWERMGSIVNAFYYLKRQYREVGLDQPDQFVRLAGLAAQSDSLDLANKVLDSAVTRFGPNDDFLFTEAKIRFHEKNLPEAERILRDLLTRHPDDPDFKMNLANSLANQQTRPKQEEALRLFKEIRPNAVDPANLDSIIVLLEKQLEEK